MNSDQFLSPSAYNINLEFKNTPFDWYKRVLHHHKIREFALEAVILNVICLFTLIRSKSNCFILKLLTTYLLLNINNKLISISDGGFNITTLLCIFLCFVNTSGKRYSYKNSYYNDFLIAVSNTFFLLCKVQLSIMYFASGVYKLQGVLWQKGVALYYILQNEEYSHPFWKTLIENNDFLIMFFTYSTIGFEVAYPFLIWNKNTRLFMLIVTCLFHTGTIFIMGLTTFGICGIVCNTIFLKKEDISFIKESKNRCLVYVRMFLKNKISKIKQKRLTL